MKILVIEDSDSIRHMIQALVASRGHEVVTASSGAKGLDIAAQVTPDLVLLDLHLPGNFDGFEVCAGIRTAEATAATPIIVISAMSDAESKQKAMTAGATAFYTKPFSPTALLKEIESIRQRAGK